MLLRGQFCCLPVACWFAVLVEQFAYYLIQGDVHVTIVAIFALKGKKSVDKEADRLVRRVMPKLSDQMRSFWVCVPLPV